MIGPRGNDSDLWRYTGDLLQLQFGHVIGPRGNILISIRRVLSGKASIRPRDRTTWKHGILVQLPLPQGMLQFGHVIGPRGNVGSAQQTGGGDDGFNSAT